MDRGDSVVYADMIRIVVGFKITFYHISNFMQIRHFLKVSLPTSFNPLLHDKISAKSKILLYGCLRLSS